LRERTKEVKEQLSQYETERDREREQFRRDEAIESFKALLIDLIKPKATTAQTAEKTAEDENGKTAVADETASSSKKSSSELSWKEAKKLLKKDARWSYCKVLEKEHKQQLYEEHMNKFRAKKRELFYQLLDDTAGIVFRSTTWKEAKRLVRGDVRYEKLHADSSFKMEREFDAYVSERLTRSKHDLRELLKQTKLITYKTASLIKEHPGQMREIEELLAKDKCWLALECVAEERRRMLVEYIDRLGEDGPPPPPTATEPVARRK
jgi:transcription elongation regulator 1